MITLIIFLAILGVLIVVHEFGHFIVAKKVGVRVEKFSLGFGPKLLKKEHDGTEYSLSSIPLGGYVKLAGDDPSEFQNKPDEYLSKPPGKRAAIVFFGPLLNYVLGILFFWLIFVIGYPAPTTKVGGLLDGYGAKSSGIEIGDRIIALDGVKVTLWEELQRIVQDKSAGNTVKLSVLRQDKEYQFSVPVKTADFSDPQSGDKRQIGLLGITPADEVVKIKHGVAESFVLGTRKTFEITIMTYQGLWRMITGKISMRQSMTGPLGIFFITSKAAGLGFVAVLHLMAVLSVSLAIFNLLPLPILDGGHIFFLAIEKIRGRRLSLKTDAVITRVGFTLMISLALFVTYNDVARMFGEKIVKLFK